MAAKKKTKPKSPQIEMPKPEKIILADLVFDPENPNEMSPDQEDALDQMLKRYGFLGPLIVAPKDKKGKRLIHHGEHRARRLIENGDIWAWGYVKKLSPLDHRMLRQGMNKTHGEHEAKKDALEIATIQKKGMLDIFSKLIGQPTELLEVHQEAVLVTEDFNPIQHHQDTFLEGNLKQLYFIFTNDQYEKLMPRLEKISKHTKTDNNTDMFMKLVKCYEDTYLKKKR